MEKKYTARLRREIVSRADREPIDPMIRNNNNSLELEIPNINAQLLIYNYSSKLNISRWSPAFRTSCANRAMSAMIGDKVWHQGLANIYNIEREDIIHHFSKSMYLKQMINMEFESNWRQEIYRLGREYYELEIEKEKDYDEAKNKEWDVKNPLRGLLYAGRFERRNISPRMKVERSLFDGRDVVSELHDKISLTELKLKTKEITQKRYYEQIKKLKDKIRYSIKQRQKLFNELFLDKEANKRYVCIRAVGDKLYGTIPEFLSLNISSVRHGMDLISHYVNWYNSLHQEAILKRQAESKKEVDRNRYNAKEKVHSKRIEKQKKVERTLLLHEKGLSSTQIALDVDVSKRTVQRWIENSA